MIGLDQLYNSNLKNYEYTIVPSQKYMHIHSKFEIESNAEIPDYFLQIVHELPTQKIDKLYLKKAPSPCIPSRLYKYCFVFKNDSYLEMEGDQILGKKYSSPIELHLKTHAGINREFLDKAGYIWQNFNLKKGSKEGIGKNLFEISGKFQFQNLYEASNELENSSSFKELEIVKKIILRKNAKNEHIKDRVGIYFSNWEELQSSDRIFYMKRLNSDHFKSESGVFLPKNTSGRILQWRENNTKKGAFEEVADLTSYSWRCSPSYPNLFEYSSSSHSLKHFLTSNQDYSSKYLARIEFWVQSDKSSHLVRLSNYLNDDAVPANKHNGYVLFIRKSSDLGRWDLNSKFIKIDL